MEPEEQNKRDLIIKIRQGYDLADFKDDYEMNPFIRVIVAEQAPKITPTARASKNPQWNTEFSYRVDEALESFDLQLFHEELTGKEKRLGAATVYLWENHGQEKKIRQVNFEAPNGEALKGDVLVSLQIVSSYRELYKQEVEQVSNKISELQKCQQDHKEDLVTLFLPFDEIYDQEDSR